MLCAHVHAVGDVLHGPQFEKQTHVHQGQDQQAEGERMLMHFHSTKGFNKAFTYIKLIQATMVVVFHLRGPFISIAPNTDTRMIIQKTKGLYRFTIHIALV